MDDSIRQAIPQGDVSALPSDQQAQRLAEFEERLHAWSLRAAARADTASPVVSVETPVFKGGWLMPCIESVISQTSPSWVFSARWDGGDGLSRQILEVLDRLGHPRLKAYFGPNQGIAFTRRFLTDRAEGDYILSLDDDDMLAPEAVDKFLSAVAAKPWSGIVRARRAFIDEVGDAVDSDPWFPFEPRHYQSGMVTDLSNHSQPALISRSAYERTAGWEGFEEFMFAGADCDIFTKIEEVAPIVLLDETLYHYRLSDKRTSLVLTDSAAYEMWRRLADKTIARIGLPLRRENDEPPFTYARVPRPHPTRETVEFLLVANGPEGSRDDDLALQRSLRSLEQAGVPRDAIRVVPGRADGAVDRNAAVRATTRALICHLAPGVVFAPEQLDLLLAAMHEREADIVGPKVLLSSGQIRCADPGFDEERLPVARGQGEHDHGQFDYIREASWLSPSLLIVRREVDNAVGGFDDAYPDGPLATADFCLKARLRDFRCVYVGTVAVEDPGLPTAGDSEEDRQRFRNRWEEAIHLLLPIGGAQPASHDAGASPEPVDPQGLTYETLCERGNDFLKDGNSDEAVLVFQRAVELEPDYPPAYEGLGRALAGQERWEEAITAFQRGTVLDPDLFWPQYHLGDALRQVECWDEAVIAYQRAVALQPEMACGHAGLGHALASLRRWEKAAAALHRATTLDPGDFWSNYQLGNAFGKLGRWQNAADVFERATQLRHPEVFWAYHGLGNAWLTLERWEEAAAAYRRATEVRWNEASIHLQLGTALMKLEHFTDAAVAYEDTIALDPSIVPAYANLGQALSLLNRWEEAVGTYSKAVEFEPDNASAYSSLGDALFQLERWEKAASAYARAIDLDPIRSEWHHSLGDALLKLGRLDEAAAAFLHANELNPPWSRRPVESSVVATERWIESLTPKADAAPTRARRTLFVFDTDYGELTTAMYLLLGEDLATRTTLLLPPRLFVTNKDILPGRTRRYDSLDDIIAAVDAEQPEVVFLSSAYVYSFHDILRHEELERLVQVLGERGCRVVTTDPFLGLLSNLGSTTTVSMDIPDQASPQLSHLKEVLDERLNRHFAASVWVLRELPHLYPAYSATEGDETPSATRAFSFFNPRLVERADGIDRGTTGSVDNAIWVFVLASRDYEVQTMFQGRDEFVDLVAGKLEQALRAGRHPVFIGPYDCVQGLIRNMAAAGRWCILEGVTLLTFCPFKRFSALVLSAEYVFYWNALSHSMFLRLFNERPVFLFDRGHLVRNVTPLYERIVDWYYQGWNPIYLDQEQELRPEQLDALADEYRAGAREVSRRHRRAPSPERMIEQILK